VRVTDVELAQPKAGEVEVAIAAAGVCHSDLHVVLGEWQHPTPVVLGHGALDLESMVSARRLLAEALSDLASGRALRQLLICAPPDDEAKGPACRDGLAP
jgi:Alcohol dehydrogenase GroES-like domain